MSATLYLALAASVKIVCCWPCPCPSGDNLVVMRSLRLGLLEERHIAKILEIERASQPAPWSEESFRRELTKEEGVFLVAEDASGVLGYAGSWIVADELHIITVAVQPELRREGIGQKLVVESLLRGQEEGAKCSTLEVRVSNTPAIKLYEKLGFKDFGRRKAYYSENKEDAEIMWLYDLATWQPPA